MVCSLALALTLAAELTARAGPARPPPRAPLALRTWPDGVPFEVTGADGRVQRGRTPRTVRVALGATRVVLGGAGWKGQERTLDVEGAATVEACVDPADQLVECLNVFPVGAAPKSVLVSEDGSQLWVALLMGPASLELYSTRSGNKLAQASVGRLGAVEMERSADGKLLYATQLDSGLVMEVEAASYRVVRTFDARGGMPKVVRRSADGRALFVANWFTDDVSEIDLVQGTLRRRMRTVKTPRGLYPTPDGRSLYVAGFGAGQLARIELATGKSTVVWSGGKRLRHLVPDEERRRLYISDMGSSQILVMDLDTEVVKPWARTAPTPNTLALSPDRRTLFVSCRGANGGEGYTRPGPEWGVVQLFDAEDGKLLDAIVGGNQCTGLDVSADGKTLAFSDFMDGRVRVYRVPSHEALERGGGGRAATFLAATRKRAER